MRSAAFPMKVRRLRLHDETELPALLRTLEPLADSTIAVDFSHAVGVVSGRLLADLGAQIVPWSRRASSGEGESSLEGVDALIEASSFTAAGAAWPDDQRRMMSSAGTVRAAHPSLVHVAVSPFGSTGPRSSWRGSDLVCAAAAGMVFVNGHPGEPPLAPFGLQAYNASALFASIAVLLGLRRRSQSGQGMTIDLSVQAAAAAAVEHATSFFRQNGAVERRRGTLHWSRSFRIARCRDGDLLLCLLGDWTTLVEWVASEAPDSDGALLREPRFEEVDARKAECEALFDVLDRWASTQSAADLAEQAQLLRLPFARVRAASELADDPQLRARTASLEGPRPGPLRIVTAARAAGAGSVAEQSSASPSTRATVSRERRPLAGVVVLDFTWVVAGPVATRILADHGARVIKVERANASDFGTRRGGLSGNLNRGKESVVLDLAKPDGRDIARRLVAHSDVVIDNFSARVMRNLGLDYDSLRAVRPDVLAVSMSGFGHTGPWRDRVSYGPTLQALAGFPYLMRHPGGVPTGWGYSWSDMAAGITAALATLAALEHRERTGRGLWVDLGQYETLVSLLGPELDRILAGGEVAPPGNRCQEGAAAPHGVFRCAPRQRSRGGVDDERWLAIAILEDDAWARLAALLVGDGEAWAAAADLTGLAGRLMREADLERRLGAWTRRHAAEDLQERLQAAGVAAALVANGEDVSLRDPQLAARGFFRTLEVPGEGALTFDGLPFAGRVLGSDVLAPGPLLGEHTEAVLRELLGLGAEELAVLRREGVIS